jgi:hypothetical protein
MTDEQSLLNAFEAGAEANELNTVSQPLGYAITFTASGSLGTEDQPDYRRFTVHRIDQPVASGPSFGTAEEVRAHLDDIARLPLWRLDLDDPSVEFDHTELAVKDVATGESFNLRGWGSGITGVSRSNQKAGLYGVAHHLSVRSDDAPTIGRWYKSNIG